MDSLKEPSQLSQGELWALGERSAKEMLGIGLQEAFDKLAAGELSDTIAEAELSALRIMLKL